jgi:hypothetical protein
MKVSYRGHEIEAKRERSMTGDVLLFYSVFRESDGYECASGFSYTSDTAQVFIDHLKARVDAELACDDPWDERGRHEDLTMGVGDGD